MMSCKKHHFVDSNHQSDQFYIHVLTRLPAGQVHEYNSRLKWENFEEDKGG